METERPAVQDEGELWAVRQQQVGVTAELDAARVFARRGFVSGERIDPGKRPIGVSLWIPSRLAELFIILCDLRSYEGGSLETGGDSKAFF